MGNKYLHGHDVIREPLKDKLLDVFYINYFLI